MADNLHSSAPHHLPAFVTAPGETDVLMIVMVFAVPLAVLLLGVTFFWLHTLPERLGHKKLQFEVVAVLGLIALFTHMHLFWVIGLLLALIDLPDLLSPLRRIASSAEKIAERKDPDQQAEVMETDPVVSPSQARQAAAPVLLHGEVERAGAGAS